MQEFMEYMEKHTQDDLAKELGVSQGAISQWITNGEIPIKRVREVALLTGISADKLHSDFASQSMETA